MHNNNDKWQDIYHASLQEKGYQADGCQIAIIAEFARIERQLIEAQQRNQKQSFGSRLLSAFRSSTEEVNAVTGLYLYGSVGRGKTFLMDVFCQHISVPTKRIHFHHFMKQVHEQLHAITDQQEPLAIVAKNISKESQILCLDEFMVTDITDAMLLYKLLKHLIDCGVVVVTTSNIVPDDLYKNGLQRQNFLPAIDLIKRQLLVIEIGEGKDFRRIDGIGEQRFFISGDSGTQDMLSSLFDGVSSGQAQNAGQIVINGREIAYVACSATTIWFEFEELCTGYRSQLDYIELAQQFDTFFVTNIPVLDTLQEDAAKRFLLLIDELYDRRISLYLSSEVAIEDIYTGNKWAFEYSRLQSRLFEMQSQSYAQTL